MSHLLNLTIFIRYYINHIIDYIFSLYYNSKRRVPKITNSLLLESATSLARKIRERQITSEDLLKVFIARIKEVNPIINAVVDVRFEFALDEAREIDAEIKNGTANFEEKPFLGVPFTTKDTMQCKGLKSTFGLICRKHVVAYEDAAVVSSLKNAGAILLAITNVPQLSMWQETANPVFGVTTNPYDDTRNVGGSSGGEAALIAACGSPFGIGTDIGGSIRIPCFMCGIFGHKPTHDLMSTKGMTFRTGNEGPTMVTAGTMTKYAEDIIPFLKVLLGTNINQLTLDMKVNINDLNIYYVTTIRSPSLDDIGAEMKDVMARTVKYFADNSKQVPQELDLPDFAHSMKIWRYWLSQEKNLNFLSDITNRQGQVHPFVEILKFITCTGDLNVYALMYIMSLLLPAPNEGWARSLTTKLKTELLAKLGSNGVLLFPSAPWSARYHYTSLLRPMNFSYCAIWNALKMPVTQVPLGLDKEGLPVGIQVIAAPFQDHLCIAVATELEKAFGGYVPPNTVGL